LGKRLSGGRTTSDCLNIHQINEDGTQHPARPVEYRASQSESGRANGVVWNREILGGGRQREESEHAENDGGWSLLAVFREGLAESQEEREKGLGRVRRRTIMLVRGGRSSADGELSTKSGEKKGSVSSHTVHSIGVRQKDEQKKPSI